MIDSYSFEEEYDASGPILIKGTPEERKFDAVLLSHAHMDHYGYIDLLREDIPIYLSKISVKIDAKRLNFFKIEVKTVKTIET